MTIKKVQIISYLQGMHPPEKGDELEQHLTISDTGRVWFTRYAAGNERYSRISESVSQASIGTSKARELLNLIETHSADLVKRCVLDAGTWDMKITYTDGTVKKQGSFLFSPESSDGIDISKVIHDAMPFDGAVIFGYYNDV